MADQPALFELQPEAAPTVSFVSVCGYCGERLAIVPNVSHEQHPPAGQETWRTAEAWCYLAAKQHEPDCPARRS